jgi:restriction system protein
MWMVRAGRGGDNVEDFIKHGLVVLGDTRLGKLDPSTKKEDLLKLFAAKYPEEKEGSRAVWASQLVRLLREIKPDDEVVTFDRDHRLYFVGTVTGEYEWVPSVIADKPHIRRVLWKYQVPRDLLRVDTRNTLGAIATLFKMLGNLLHGGSFRSLPGMVPSGLLRQPEEMRHFLFPHDSRRDPIS